MNCMRYFSTTTTSQYNAALCKRGGRSLNSNWVFFFYISTTHWEAKLHFGFSLDSDGWLTAGFSFSGCCRLCDSDCTSSNGVCWCYCLKSGNNRLRGDRVMRHHWFELVCSKYAAYKKCDPNQELGAHLKVEYPFLPLDGNVSLDRNPWDRRFRTSLHLLVSSLFFSQFLTVFSRRWSSINTHQVGIYQEDFVLWSEANNYQIWWKTEHILRLYVISLSLLSATRVCLHMH